jgi:protein-disulfide isomerase
LLFQEKPMDKPSDPIRLPNTPPDAESDTLPRDPTVSLPISTLYYILIAIIFFAVGFIVAWVAFSTTQIPSLVADVQSAAADGARNAVRSELQSLQSQLAGLSGGGGGGSAPAASAPTVPVSIEEGSSPTWGPEGAPVTIVEFSDFQCPFCARYADQTYPLLRETYGDRVRYVFKHYPIAGLHPDAERAGMAAECAHEQDRFWEYHEALFANQANLSQAALLGYARQVEIPDLDQFTQCLTTQKYAATVQADLLLGDRLGVSGTPTFFINGIPMMGAQPYAEFELAIEQALQDAGAQG